jgi:hypothetical protein
MARALQATGQLDTMALFEMTLHECELYLREDEVARE